MAAWRSSPTSWSGGFELPNESQLTVYRRNLSKSIRFYKTARRELRRRKATAA